MPDPRRTRLYDAHLAAGARMVDFAGWAMPVRYGSIVDEHHAVRRHAGMFDVSHMGRFRITGPQAEGWIDRVVTSDAGRLDDHRGFYTVMCREDGGIIDDLIVYRLAPNSYLLVVNAANREGDFAWIESVRGEMNAAMHDLSEELAMIAVQGPDAMGILESLAGDSLDNVPRFGVTETALAGVPTLVARTGYTGEDGAEIMPPADRAEALWKRLLEAGIVPCGLGARDTLRLEAALALYGNDIDTSTNPIEAGLGWLVHLDDGHFVGAEALRRIRETGPARKLVGVSTEGRDIPRAGSPLRVDGADAGILTSGTFSPTLNAGIGMGYLRADCARPGQPVEIVIRGKSVAGTTVRLPFYRRS